MSRFSDTEPCPHCGVPTGPGVPNTHACGDKEPWTQDEKDLWLAQTRYWYPALQFAPPNEHFAWAFGDLNRRR